MTTSAPTRLATVEVAGELFTVDVQEFEAGRGRGKVIARGDVGDFLRDATLGMGTGEPREEVIEFSERQLAPVVTRPGKIICMGLNYRQHIEEMGHPLPEHPTLFSKFATALTTPYGTVKVPEGLRDKCDYEGELAFVMGHGGQIAGYAILNEFSQRDWQYRTLQWLQGKNLDESCAFGPWLTLASAYDPIAEGAMLRTWVNGDLRQEHSVADVVFAPKDLVAYIQQFATLEAGDVVVTGTPEGVGHGMEPPHYLQDGDDVRIEIEGLGAVRSSFRM